MQSKENINGQNIYHYKSGTKSITYIETDSKSLSWERVGHIENVELSDTENNKAEATNANKQTLKNVKKILLNGGWSSDLKKLHGNSRTTFTKYKGMIDKNTLKLSRSVREMKKKTQKKNNSALLNLLILNIPHGQSAVYTAFLITFILMIGWWLISNILVAPRRKHRKFTTPLFLDFLFCIDLKYGQGAILVSSKKEKALYKWYLVRYKNRHRKLELVERNEGEGAGLYDLRKKDRKVFLDQNNGFKVAQGIRNKKTAIDEMSTRGFLAYFYEPKAIDSKEWIEEFTKPLKKMKILREKERQKIIRTLPV